MEKNEDIKEAIDGGGQLSRDETLRRIALKEELLRMDINQAKADAAKYGRAEGEKDTKEKMIKKLYEINMPIEKIAEVAEIDIAEVKKIIDKIK